MERQAGTQTGRRAAHRLLRGLLLFHAARLGLSLRHHLSCRRGSALLRLSGSISCLLAPCPFPLLLDFCLDLPLLRRRRRSSRRRLFLLGCLGLGLALGLALLALLQGIT